MRGSVVYGCMSVRGNARSRAVFKDSDKRGTSLCSRKCQFSKAVASAETKPTKGRKERRNELWNFGILRFLKFLAFCGFFNFVY